jgi:hypothetical protein
MRFRLRILLFCVIIFVLAVIGLMIVYSGEEILRFWSTFAYIITLLCVYVFLAHPLLVGDRKLSCKKVALLTVSMMMTGLIFAHSVWTIVTPNWVFSVATDKSTYSLGEDAQITVSLENAGFIAHSFKSSFSDPVIVSIERFVHRQVWYSPFHHEVTEFTVPAHQSIAWVFIWNQTNKNYPAMGIEPGKYYIKAVIESATSDSPFWDPIFYASASINVTST